MNVAPQSTLSMLSDIPLDREYSHTIWFSSLSAQHNYMVSKNVHTFNNLTYVRIVESGEFQVSIPVNAEDVRKCNYCMIRNGGFSDKWYYAFVTNIEYVNNDTTRITCLLDHWQTYMTEIAIGMCYVEREHVSDDAIGNHTLEENLPVGEYVSQGDTTWDAGLGVLVQMAYETGGTVTDNMFTGLTQHGASLSGAGSIADLLNQFADQPEKVAMVSMCSAGMVKGSEVGANTTSFGMSRNTDAIRFNGSSYTPVNKKLWCYPYTFLSVDNYNGNSEVYHWENFSDVAQANFVINESPTPRPAIECYPVNYAGLTDAHIDGIEYDNFPMCPFVIDTYRAWASQALPKTAISTGAQLVMGTIKGGLPGAVSGLLGGVANIATTAVDNSYHKIHSTSVGGNIGSGGLNFYKERVGFRFISYSVRPEIARVIDNYFTRFGYRVMEYKVPNFTSRTSFNYVKTVESNVGGEVSQKTIDVIESSLNRGITLWHTPQVKNYSLNNDVRSEYGEKKKQQ